MPYIIYRFQVLLVASQRRYVRHTRVHISCTYRMANRFMLINYFFMRLAVFMIEMPRSTPQIEKKFSKIQVFLFPCYPVEPGQAGFNNLVTRKFFFPTMAKCFNKQVRIFSSYIEQ